MSEIMSSDQPVEGGVDEEAIRQRAYEISQGEDAGSAEENWARAERELAGGSASQAAREPDDS